MVTAPVVPVPTVAPQVIRQSSTPQEMVRQAVIAKWGEHEWPAAYEIIMHESSFNPDAVNPSSKSCGLFQALPCSKMGGMELDNQVKWGVGYIEQRYGTPTNAWSFWKKNLWY